GGDAAPVHSHRGTEGAAIPARHPGARGAERDADADHRDDAADQLSRRRRRRRRDGVRVSRLRSHDARGRALQRHRAGRGGGAGRRVPGRGPQLPRASALTAGSRRVWGREAVGRRAREGGRGGRRGFPGGRGGWGGGGGHMGAPHAVWRRRLAALGASRPATVGLGIVLVWIVLAILSPAIAPYNPNANDVAALAHPPTSRVPWLRTDHPRPRLLSPILSGARPPL